MKSNPNSSSEPYARSVALKLVELVLQQLRLLSEVAYVRFASVYRQFQSIRDFVDTLDDLSRLDETVKRKLKQLILVIQNSLTQHMSSRTLALGMMGLNPQEFGFSSPR